MSKTKSCFPINKTRARWLNYFCHRLKFFRLLMRSVKSSHLGTVSSTMFIYLGKA